MMMNNTITPPYSSSSSKTDLILSRYRPIAPKPPLVEGPTTPDNTQQSPFSRNHSYLLTKPCRNRKRGRSGCLPATTTKRAKACNLAFSSPLAQNTHLSFGHGLFPQFPKPLNLVTLPFLPYPSSSTSPPQLNIYSREIPKEMDLLQNLHAAASKGNVISPRAVRPVGSSISVECIEENPECNNKCISKKPEEVEAEIELENLPALVSDSSNRVRLVNSAYMEMVGQPECLWLDSMASCGGACKRIGGKVKLDLASGMPLSSDGFTCKARIEWGSCQDKTTIDAHCDVLKLSCQSKDYLFTWRFHTNV